MPQMECRVLAVATMCEKHWKRSPADGAFPSLCIGVVRWHVDNRLVCSAQVSFSCRSSKRACCLLRQH
eukprot:s6638_g2.t1